MRFESCLWWRGGWLVPFPPDAFDYAAASGLSVVEAFLFGTNLPGTIVEVVWKAVLAPVFRF